MSAIEAVKKALAAGSPTANAAKLKAQYGEPELIAAFKRLQPTIPDAKKALFMALMGRACDSERAKMALPNGARRRVAGKRARRNSGAPKVELFVVGGSTGGSRTIASEVIEVRPMSDFPGRVGRSPYAYGLAEGIARIATPRNPHYFVHVRGVEEGSDRWYELPAVAIAAASMSRYLGSSRVEDPEHEVASPLARRNDGRPAPIKVVLWAADAGGQNMRSTNLAVHMRGAGSKTQTFVTLYEGSFDRLGKVSGSTKCYVQALADGREAWFQMSPSDVLTELMFRDVPVEQLPRLGQPVSDPRLALANGRLTKAERASVIARVRKQRSRAKHPY